MSCFQSATGFGDHVEDVPTNTAAGSDPYLSKYRRICCTKASKRTVLPKLSPTARTNTVEEARILVKRCADPCSAGETYKGAIRRAAQRLRFSFIRTRAVWYGEARRIDASEMDRLRQVAEEVELSLAISAIETLIAKAGSDSAEAQNAIAGLAAALKPLGSTYRARIPNNSPNYQLETNDHTRGTGEQPER
jgi:hypothetical protein